MRSLFEIASSALLGNALLATAESGALKLPRGGKTAQAFLEL
jgi:hypothetical protein